MYPYPNAVITGILSMIVASGGSFGPFTVTNNNSQTSARADQVYATHIIDGDTFEIASGERIRLAEVNAPEQGECYFDEAKKALTKILSGKPLRLIKDETGQDKFGRLLRIVNIDTEDARTPNIVAQEYLAAHGFVRYDPHGNRAYQDGIKTAEGLARANERGMWSVCKKEIKKNESAPAPWVDADVPPEKATCVIKGNVSDSGFGKQYFMPSCKNYSQIKITPEKGDRYFCTEREAIRAKFKKSANCS